VDNYRQKPYEHQTVGIEKILECPYLFIADEMGAGKTFQVINGAQELASRGLIDTVVIICPAAVRSVWFDPELGELAKWLWISGDNHNITLFHSKIVNWKWDLKSPKTIRWVITNYDYIRNKDHRKKLAQYCSKKTLLVGDESSALKNWRAAQTKAFEELRSDCGRVILLNGTPIDNNPGDLYSQAHILNPSILGCKTFFHFRARYAKMGGWQGRQIIGWHSLEDLQERMRPYVLRRLKKDCLDLPEKIPAVTIQVPLTSATWKIYKEMRDDMVAWLTSDMMTSASQAIVKVTRLAQITSGFVGGVESEDRIFEDAPEWVEGVPEAARAPKSVEPIQEVGREKLVAFLDWMELRLAENPNVKMLVWGKFRPEVKRLFDTLKEEYTFIETGLIWGGQKQPERDIALRLLVPRTAPPGPVVVVGTPATGSMGLNLTAATIVVYLSNDFSLKVRLQSEDRAHRPGQKHPVSYFDFVATGPSGQKTIDHRIAKALHDKETIANFTTSTWVSVLSEE
jgi:SNF2 family DNA or RNA helicase